MRLELSDDVARINAIAGHPSIWPFIKQTHSDHFDCTGSFERVLWFLCVEGDRDVGFYAMEIRSSCWLDYHGGLLPEYRGRYALRALKAAIRMAFEEPQIEVLTTHTPTHRPEAGRLNALAGMRRVGQITSGVHADGRLQDYIIYQTTRKEVQ